MFLQLWKPAYDQYVNAEKIYSQYQQEEEVQTRLAQIKRMSAACWANYEATLPKDSLSKTTDNPTNKENETTQLKDISTIINSQISTILVPYNTLNSVKYIIKKNEKIKLEK
jgi:tetratricopeptide repeat protein